MMTTGNSPPDREAKIMADGPAPDTPELYWSEEWGRYMIGYWWHPVRDVRLVTWGLHCGTVMRGSTHADMVLAEPGHFGFPDDLARDARDMFSEQIVIHALQLGWVRLTIWGEGPRSLEVCVCATGPRAAMNGARWAVGRHPGIDRAEIEFRPGKAAALTLGQEELVRFLSRGALPPAASATLAKSILEDEVDSHPPY